jgi:hypothetical protein
MKDTTETLYLLLLFNREFDFILFYYYNNHCFLYLIIVFKFLLEYFDSYTIVLFNISKIPI